MLLIDCLLRELILPSKMIGGLLFHLRPLAKQCDESPIGIIKKKMGQIWNETNIFDESVTSKSVIFFFASKNFPDLKARKVYLFPHL